MQRDLPAEGRPPWERLAAVVESGRQLLAGGRADCDVYQQLTQTAAATGISARDATLLNESIGSVFARHRSSPLAAGEFVAEVVADMRALSSTERPAGLSSLLYPRTLPGRFFARPSLFLDAAQRAGVDFVQRLWSATEGAGPCPGGKAHCGQLKDGRRYAVLRLPPPQHRLEAHFLACVAGRDSAPPRCLAMERGVTHEESVLAETLADGTRIRLGQAGPAESKNFIRLIRQQLRIEA